MSSRARLLLHSAPGAGTAERASGDASLRFVDACEVRPVHPRVVGALSSTLGRLLSAVGADALVPQEWSAVPGVAHLSVLSEAMDALEDPGCQDVLVLCGDDARLREIAAAPCALARVVTSALTASVAMWQEPGTESERRSDAVTVFEALSEAHLELTRMQAALEHERTTAWVDSAASAERLAVLGVGACVDTGYSHEYFAGLREQSLSVEESDGGYVLSVPLPGAASARARVGRHGDSIVVELDGVSRWLRLPPALTRCRTTGARRVGAGLLLRFEPDAALWPRGSAA